MTEGLYRELRHGISCIDAAYIRPGMACFYLLREGEDCAVIETGTSHSVANLVRLLRTYGIDNGQVRYVVPTHVHLDHAGGAGAMMALFPEAQLLVHPRGAAHLANPERLVASSQAVYGEERFRELYGEITPVDARRIEAVADGRVVHLGARALEFRHTRGHADHHLCVWDGASDGWFSGDMFGLSYPWFRFPGGDFVMPATTPTQFRPAEFLASLELLASYHPRRMYLTHYGELPYTEAALALLSRQVADYPELARRHGARPAGLAAAIIDYTLALMDGLDLVFEAARMRQRLAFDADLNAQGLGVWLQRQA